jgi:putative peptidoglycan lipid II flippase
VKASIAALFGAGMESDAYFAAFTVPQQIGDYLIGGILFLVIIPVFQKRQNDAGEAQAAEDVSGLLNLSFAALLALSILYFILIPVIIPELFPGFEGAKLELTINLCKYFTPALLLMGLSLIYTAFYHAHRNFFLPALTSILFPLSSLAALWLLPGSFGIKRLIWGNIAGTALGLLIMIFYMRKHLPWNIRNWNVWNPISKNALLLATPVLLCFLVGRIIPFLQKGLASELSIKGALSLLEYSFYIATIVYSLISGPVSTTIFPLLSKQVSEGKDKLAARSFANALKALTFLVFPLWVFLVFESETLVDCLLKYGKFQGVDVSYCSGLIVVYSFFIFPATASKLISHMFFVRQETKVISYLGIVMTILSIPLYFILSARWGIYGIAATFSIMHTAIALSSFILLKMRCAHLKLSLFTKNILYQALIALLISVAIVIFRTQTSFSLENPYFRLIVGSAAIFGSYFFAAYFFKLEELRFIARRLPVIGPKLNRFFSDGEKI